MNLPANISISNAPLPRTYEAAKVALANCTNIDECKDWADKAQAMASYARQANDDSLHQYATRIQQRAVRRCGELLKQFDARGDNNRKIETDATDSFYLPPSQAQVARSAGLSERQQVTAVRVANIPREEFDAVVDGPEPTTVSKLAEMGKRVLTEPKPAGFNEAIHTIGAMRRFVEKCREHDAALIAGAVAENDVPEVREYVSALDSWLDRFVVNLKG